MDASAVVHREVKVEIIFQSKVTKKFRFSNDDTVWVAKQTVLIEFASLSLRDPLNYGFYMPPLHGKAGKFLDEERPLRDYPAESYGDHLEFRYKRRIYRGINMEEKKLQKYQSKPYQKKFVDYLVTGSIEKARKLLEKGLDPNFQIESTGETPLTAMSMLPNSTDGCMLLVGFSAYLDYRSADGMTAMHKAAINNRDDNIAFLLDLGASPNYKDAKGLTPLWHGLLAGASDHCCELLLNERATLGAYDHQGCKEIHLACRKGYDRHLDHLIFYGADLNCRTGTGNTPLHICAITNQANCARILLFRGADSAVVNYGNQTAHEVAILSGNKDLADLINEFDASHITPFIEKPLYSRRRRDPTSLSRTSSPSPKTSTILPVPENHELFRSVTVSNKAELEDYRENKQEMFLKSSRKTSNNNMTLVSENDTIHPDRDRKHPESDDSGSECSDSDEEAVGKHKKVNRRTFSTGAIGKKAPAPIKSGLGSKTQAKSRLYQSIPGRQFVAVVDYHPRAAGELALEKGDAVDVLYIGEQGFWEGRAKDQTGWFPSSCIQELKKANRKEKNRTWFGKKSGQKEIIEKCAKPDKATSRSVLLKKGDRGFGFQLRGANSHTARIEFTPSVQFPALQYIGEVDKGGVAEKAGLKSGDFVLEVNGEDVINATHGYVVSLVANTGKALSLKIVTVAPEMSIPPDLADGPVNVKAKAGSNQPDLTNGRAAPSKDTKKTPPPPLPRSQYSSFTVGNLNSSASLTEVSMSPSVDTVMTLDKKVQRKRSVKSMWSDTAWKLHPEAIKTEEISKGVVRKTKGTMDQEGEIGIPIRSNSVSSRSSASSPNVNNAVPFSTLPRRVSRTSSQNSDESASSDSQNRHTVPPNYEVTLENMRRLGRKPSFQRSESEKKLAVAFDASAAETKPRAVSTSSDVFPPPPFSEAPSYSPPPPPAGEQQAVSRSMSVPSPIEQTTVRPVTRTASEPIKADSASSDEDEPSSDFAKALRQVATARKQRTRASKVSIDESIALRKKDQCLQVIKENEESTKTFTSKSISKSPSSEAILQQREKGVDHHSLYAASSTSSLDTQTSKDSGIDVSDVMSQAPGEQPPDLASALANAVARRAEKIAKKDPATKTAGPKNVPRSQPRLELELHSVRLKPSQQVGGVGSNPVKKEVKVNNAPPPTRPKPNAKVATNRIEDEAAADVAVVSQEKTEAKSNAEVSKEPDVRNEILTPPLMFASVDDANEAKEVVDENTLTSDLPSPPVELMNITDSLSEKTQPVTNNMTASDPPPPYSPPRVKSDLPTSIASKPFPQWTADDVGQWLDYLNMGQYKSSFVDNDIQGSHLPDLSKDDLSELGVKKLGHRLTIDDAIGKLRSQLQYSEV